MNTPKARNKPSDAPLKSSPVISGTSRVSKGSGSESESSSNPNAPGKLSIERAKANVDRKPARGPITEKKRPSKVIELETKLSQLQEDLKKARDHLNLSELSKKKALCEVEEAKKQLLSMTAKLEDSQLEFIEFSKAEESRIQELRRISEDRDCVWQSELEAIRKQHTMDSESLGSAIVEIQRLKKQLAARSELPGASSEIVESLQTQLRDSKETEAMARLLVAEGQNQLLEARNEVEALQADRSRLLETLKSKVTEIEESNALVGSLREVLNNLAPGSSQKALEMEVNDQESKKRYEAAMAEAELARAAERDALVRLQCVTEESKKSSQMAAKATEQLESARAMNMEMESELKKLRVQSEQWRKAAETAAAVLTTGSGRFMERSVSMEPDYSSIAVGRFSPFSDELSDESPKRKNGNVLKRIGGLWKKGAKAS